MDLAASFPKCPGDFSPPEMSGNSVFDSSPSLRCSRTFSKDDIVIEYRLFTPSPSSTPSSSPRSIMLRIVRGSTPRALAACRVPMYPESSGLFPRIFPTGASYRIILYETCSKINRFGASR